MSWGGQGRITGVLSPPDTAHVSYRLFLAPVIGWLWIKPGSRDPSSPVTFSIGLLGVGLGFVLLIPAAKIAADGALVSPMWLTSAYLIHTLADICLSPVGLSSMTTLAPARRLLIKHKDEWSGDLDIAAFAPLSVKTEHDFPDILADENPDVWKSNRPAKTGDTGTMFRQIIEQAVALKTARAAKRPRTRKA